MRFNWGRLPGEVRAIGGFQRRALPARPGSSCHWVRRSPTIRRPGAGRGPVPLVFIVCLVACFRLAVIGRVSPRLASAPSLHPRPAGRVETRPHGLRHRSDNSRRPRAALGAAEGESAAGSASPLPAPCRANVCIVTECPAPSSRVRHSETTCHSGHGRYPRRRCPAGGLRLRSAQSMASRAQGAMAAGLSSASSGTVQ